MKGFLWWVLINHDVHSLMNSIPEQEDKEQESQCRDGQWKDLDEQEAILILTMMESYPLGQHSGNHQDTTDGDQSARSPQEWSRPPSRMRPSEEPLVRISYGPLERMMELIVVLN